MGKVKTKRVGRGLEVGSWNKRPHYSVVGHRSDFYVYSSERPVPYCWSGSVKGKTANDYYTKFLKFQKDKDDAGFIALVDEIFKKYPNPPY